MFKLLFFMGKLYGVIHFLNRIQVNSLNYLLTNPRFHTNTVENDGTTTTLLSDHSQDCDNDMVSQNKMLSWYVNNGKLQHAQKVFGEMPVRDVVSWNTMLLGFRKAKDSQRVYECLLQMLRAGLRPSGHTISLVLSSDLNALVSQLHGFAVRSALSSSLFVASALMRGYAELGDPGALKNVFDEVRGRDVSTWNALLSGYTRLGLMVEARRVFDAMPEKNVVSWTSLVNGYIVAKQIGEARVLFDAMGEKNVVSWTAMIGGYVRGRGFSECLGLFVSMVRSGVRPNNFTYSTVLVACAGTSSLLAGRQVHTRVSKHRGGPGPENDVVLSSSLVDMYAKCGDIESASRVFKAICDKNVVAWNAVVGGYARHGLAARAVEEFERMVRRGVGPDHVTFVNVLSGCAHGGLVEEAEKIFRSMEEKHGVQAGPEHYACMVDMYGRAGAVEKAAKLVGEMPVEPDMVVWGALLAGSRSGSEIVEKDCITS